MSAATARSTAGTVATPPFVWIPKMRAPENCSPFRASTSRVNAGDSGISVGSVSTSSSTISEFNVASPTNFRLARSAGGTALVPKPGRFCWASE